MAKKKIASFDDLLSSEVSGIAYVEIEAYGGVTIRLGSLSTEEMLEWIEERDDPAKKRIAGVRLIVKSIVDEHGTRVPEVQRDRMVRAFLQKNQKENVKVVDKIMELNGMEGGKGKNGSSATATDTNGSRTDSPSPSAS